jgi:hypothetical protein
MDTINVAILKNGTVINCLVFGTHQDDAEIQTFAEIVGGDSFQKLEFNQIVVDGAVVTLEKPSADSVWSTAVGNWVSPTLFEPSTPSNIDSNSVSDEEKAEYAAWLTRQESNN